LPTSIQNPLTVVAEISPGRQAGLNELLTTLGQNPVDNVQLPLGKVATLHFSCFVIVPADAPYPPSLVFEANFDGDPDAYLDALIAVGLEGLLAIYGHCAGFPDQATAAQLKDFLRTHSVPSAAFYVGCRGQSVQSLRNAIAVREAIEGFLDKEQAAGKIAGSSRQILERIQAHLGSPGVVSPEPSQVTVAELAKQAKRNTLILILVGILLFPLILLLILIWAPILRIREYRDNHATPPPPLPIDPRLYTHPDIRTQSHLTTMSTVRGGPVRALTLKFVLWVTQLLARTVAIDGNLLGIPTIHFARWAMMDNNKRMIFFSNYDGSWASYLGDFVDKAKYGLTAIWGNTDRFPPSKWLAFGGAGLINPFKEWSLEHNLYAPFYYRAYPSATVANLLNDLSIRDSVGRSMSESEASAFLKLL
jgi:hypothetical protein